MEILSIGEKLCVLGCRWRTATTSAKLEKDSWLDEWNADTFITLNHDSRRFSIGVLENSATADIQVSKKRLFSLAAVVNDEIKNGIAIFEIADINDERRYWVALYNNGVPEMDFADKNLSTIVKVLSKRLNNKIENLLSVSSPVLMTNLGEEKNGNDFQAILLLREFNLIERGYEELHLMVEGSKTGGMKLNQSLAKQFNASYFKDMDAEERRKLSVYAGLTVVGIVSLFSIWPSNNDFSLPDAVTTYRAPTPVVAARQSVDVDDLIQQQIVKFLGDYMLGANKNLFFEKRDRYRRAPDFVFGYRKEQMTCAIALARCEVTYKAEGAYREFDLGLSSLRPLFDDVVFNVQGDVITGSWKITPDMVYTTPTGLSDLPPNDRGESVVGDAMRLRTTRPGLSVSISGVQAINIPFDEIKELDRRTVQHSFIQVGWTASGLSHQADLFIDTFKRPNMTINSWRLSKTDGLENFTMGGGFLMRTTR